MRFTMTLDRAQQVSTALVLAIVPLVLTVAAVSARLPAPALALGIGVVGALLVTWALAPIAIEVDSHEIRVVRRGFGPLRIPRIRVLAIEPGPRPHLRLFGAAGFFGSFGLFWTRHVGSYWLAMTRRGPLLTIRRRDALPLVVGADDAEGLRRALEGFLLAR